MLITVLADPIPYWKIRRAVTICSGNFCLWLHWVPPTLANWKLTFVCEGSSTSAFTLVDIAHFNSTFASSTDIMWHIALIGTNCKLDTTNMSAAMEQGYSYRYCWWWIQSQSAQVYPQGESKTRRMTMEGELNLPYQWVVLDWLPWRSAHLFTLWKLSNKCLIYTTASDSSVCMCVPYRYSGQHWIH